MLFELTPARDGLAGTGGWHRGDVPSMGWCVYSARALA